jgi:threonine aldolase
VRFFATKKAMSWPTNAARRKCLRQARSLLGIPGVAGRFDVQGLREALSRHPRGVLQSVQPAALSLSQVTEAGTLYEISQITALTAVAKEAGLHCHLDGARFANALVALDVTPAQMTWQAGIDVVSFGATKNGCLACEAVVFSTRPWRRTLPFAANGRATHCPRGGF